MKNDVGRECGTLRSGDKRAQGFGGKAGRRDNLKDRGVDGRTVSEEILGRHVRSLGLCGMDSLGSG
jgi:hypothetical protein